MSSFFSNNKGGLVEDTSIIKKEGEILGVLGVLNVLGENFLAVIKEAEVLGDLYGASIYKID